MLIGLYFKKKRLEKGLSEEELAILIGPDFQKSLFWDFESGDDSDIDGFSIQEFKKYCEILNIKPTDYADIPISDIQEMPLSILIKTRREEMGYSINDLSELIGYEKNVIQAIEEEWSNIVVCLDVIKQIAMVLGIPLRLLLEKI